MSLPEEQLEGSTEPTLGEEQMFKGSLKKNLPKEPPGGTTKQTWTETAPDSEDFTYQVKMNLSGGRKVQKMTASCHRMEEQTAGQQETDR